MEMVPAHRHCRVCGTPTPMEDRYCSPKCSEKHADQVRQQRLYTLIFVALVVFTLLALVVHL